MTFILQPHLLVRWTVREGHVPVADVVEEVDLVAVEQQACPDRVHGRVSPPLIEEPAVFVERVEEVDVGLRPQPVEVADFEVGPLKKYSY